MLQIMRYRFLILCIIGVARLYVDEYIPINTDIKSYVPADMPALVIINTVTNAIGNFWMAGLQVEVTGANIVNPYSLAWMYTWINNGILPEYQEEIDEILAAITA